MEGPDGSIPTNTSIKRPDGTSQYVIGNPEDIRLQEREREATSKTLKALFPEKEFHLVNSDGSSCIVYSDGKRIYKVFIDRGASSDEPLITPDRFVYAQREAINLKLLSERNASPELLGYISPYILPNDAEQLGADLDAYQNTTPHLPVIIMEGINMQQLESLERAENFTNTIDSIDDKTLFSEIQRLIEVLEKLHLFPGDTEILWDINSQRLVFVDVGGMMDSPILDEQGNSTIMEHILNLLPSKTQVRMKDYINRIAPSSKD